MKPYDSVNMGLHSPNTLSDASAQGCYELVTSFIETNMSIIAGVAFGIAFSQVRWHRRGNHEHQGHITAIDIHQRPRTTNKGSDWMMDDRQLLYADMVKGKRDNPHSGIKNRGFQ